MAEDLHIEGLLLDDFEKKVDLSKKDIQEVFKDLEQMAKDFS